MNARLTLFWTLVAAGLFAFIFIYQRHVRPPQTGPVIVLPQLNAAAVTSVRVRPAGNAQPELRVDRTNQTWVLTAPISYPAEAQHIENLLKTLAGLTAVTHLTADELRDHPQAAEDFGFTPPRVCAVDLQQGAQQLEVLVGARTSPGDQVFVQAPGTNGVCVVDAGLLRLIPTCADDWRARALADLRGLPFDRIAVTNNTKVFVVQRDGTNGLWRMVWPSEARADNARIQDALGKLQALRVLRFIPDDAKTDLEALGLAPPALELALAQGTNTLLHLDFGDSPTNNANEVYARRHGLNALATVAKDLQEPWRSGSVSDFRDPRLLTLTAPVNRIDVRAADRFTLQSETNGAWRVLPAGLPADPTLVGALLSALTNLQITRFVKDVVNPPDLPEYGLAEPACEFLLRTSPTNATGTNELVADLSFGLTTNAPGRLFARRADETSVYAVRTNDFARLPGTSWQFRDRRLWHITPADVASVTIEQKGKTRQILRRGEHQWSLAPGSQGIVDELAVEETVRLLTEASADAWVARGEAAPARFGFDEHSSRITLGLKNQDAATVRFSGFAGSTDDPYAAITLDGEPWILEFPWPVYRYVAAYLTVP